MWLICECIFRAFSSHFLFGAKKTTEAIAQPAYVISEQLRHFSLGMLRRLPNCHFSRTLHLIKSRFCRQQKWFIAARHITPYTSLHFPYAWHLSTAAGSIEFSPKGKWKQKISGWLERAASQRWQPLPMKHHGKIISIGRLLRVKLNKDRHKGRFWLLASERSSSR